MKLSTKTGLKDILAIFILGSVALFFSYKLFMDFNKEITQSNSDVLGKVIHVENKPQRSFSGRSIWSGLSQGSSIYYLDTIKTYDKDRITILLNDGVTELSLESNSMIRMEKDSITFAEGTISAINRSEKETEIDIQTSDGSTLQLSQGSVNMTIDETGKTNMALDEAKAVLKTQNGTPMALEGNKLVSFSNSDNIESIRDIPIKLEEPQAQKSYISYEENQEISFKWETSLEGDQQMLLISRSPLMNDPFFSQTVEGQTYSLVLPVGQYYWQIQNQDAKSIIGSFRILRENSPIPDSPVENQRFLYRNRLPQISFQWQKGNYADKYRIQISENRDFSSIQTDIEVDGNFYFTNSLEEGQFWWRIQPHTPLGGGQWLPFSSVQSFHLQRDIELQKTRLLSPANSKSYTSFDKSEGIRFYWEADRDAREFTFQLSSSEDFTQIIDERVLQENRITLELLPEGTYYWKVKGQTYDELDLPESEVNQFTVIEVEGSISYLSPDNNATLQKNPADLLKFSWASQMDGFFQFRLWYKKTGDIEERLIQDNLTRNKSLLAVLPGNGMYRWEVSQVDGSNEILAQGGDRLFYVSSPLRAPIINTPSPDSHLRLIGTPSLFIEWEAIEKADYYNLVLFKQGQSDPVLEKKNLTENALEIKDFTSFTEGEYHVELYTGVNQPIAGFADLSEPAIRNFHIDELSIYTPITLSSPGNGQVFEYPQFLRNEVQLRWNAPAEIVNFEIYLYGSLEQEIPLYIFNSRRPSFTPIDLNPGIYYWQIAGKDSRGYSAPDSEKYKFQILPLQSPERPVLLQPQKNEIIDMTEKDSLLFQWQGSEDADYYRLILIDSEGKEIFQRANLRETEFLLKDLTVLDIGTFNIEITASKKWEDLDLYLSSLPYTSQFEIVLEQEFEIPDIRSSNVQFTE